MKLLALVLLLPTFFLLTLTEVAKDQNDWKKKCKDFFFQNPRNPDDIIVPTILQGPQYKMICQLWKGKYRFATLYDTHKRIPVYSASRYIKKQKTKRRSIWKFEPQLENINSKTEMRRLSRDVGKIKHQAVALDYIGSGYARGHVFPCLYAADQNQADSTFTLTNIAPQTQTNNNQWNHQVEKPMLKEIKENCELHHRYPAYIVTGVVPGDKWISITRNKLSYDNGINIPSYFWSAFCCTSKKNHKKLTSQACIAEQGVFNSTCLSIDELNQRLTAEYRKRNSLKENENFCVFPGLSCENIKISFKPKILYINVKTYRKTVFFG